MHDDDFERDLARRLRAYEANVPAAAAEAKRSRPNGHRFGWLVFAVGGASVIAAGLLAFVLLRPPNESVGHASPTELPSLSQSAEPTSSTSPSQTPLETPSPTVTPLPTPKAGAAEVHWMTQGSVEGQTEVVQRLGDHWYVGGSVRVNEGSQGAIWRSADGRDWGEPSLLDPEPPARPDVVPEGEIFFPEAYRVSEIAEWQGSLYAFGWHHFGCCDGTLSMLWRSEDDGVTWAEVNTEGTAYSGSHFPNAWWVAGDGSLALYSATGLGGSGSVFMTSDMETWTEYPIQVPDDRFMTPYTAAGGTTGGLVVGVEYTYPNGATAPEEAPVMWQSTDGRSWSLVAAPPAAGQLDAVAWDAEHEQFVVIGKDAADQLTAWRSTDLRTWSASSMAGEPATVVDLAAADGVIAAIGSIGAPGGNIRTTAWTSYDADVWWVSRLADGARGGQIGVTLEGMVAAVSTPSGVEGQTPTGWDAWAGQFAE